MQHINKNKEAVFNEAIKTPFLGQTSSLYKTNNSKGAIGKFEFEHFLKSVELICIKLFPNENLDESIKFLIENYLLKLKENFKDSKEKTTNSYFLQNLMTMLDDKNMVFINLLF